MIIALIGNPNCGKTTIFNSLTSSSQRVGNWPGVTVERKSGFFKQKDQAIEVVDLPGIYSLTHPVSLDERITSDFVYQQKADLFINILDANNLERNLYLTMQLIEMRVPMVVALNMMDTATARRKKILLNQLENELGCKVIPLEAHKGKGISALKQAIENPKISAIEIRYPEAIEKALSKIAKPRHEAIHLLENESPNPNLLEDSDILIADTRYRFIHTIVKHSVETTITQKSTWTKRIDEVILNRFLGIPIFLAVMYCMFFFAINIGGAFQDFFDLSSSTIFIDGVAYLLTQLGSPEWLIALLANGLGKGINTVVTFIPVIGAMFFFLALLEDSGYMARAAFVIDRLMRMLGLPGKSFVPMIVGFGCNVPAVMAARTLENNRDRILTIMMSPFMSCSARLAIFAVFTAAFFPVGGQNIVFLLYLTGIFMAVLTGFLLRRTLLQGKPAPLIMELPPYHLPTFKSLSSHAWQRLKGFVLGAGKLIIPICILLGFLNAGESTQTWLASFGKAITPIFAPLGIHHDNWPATVGLLSGVLAKEVVIGTLNTLYQSSLPAADFHFWQQLSTAVSSIPVHLAALTHSLANPLLARAPIHSLDQQLYGTLAAKFDGQIGALSYLLFVLLYFPCVSTLGAMWRELSRGWTIFSVVWMTTVAYGTSVLFYQSATLLQHPISSSIWIAGLAFVFTFIISGMQNHGFART